MSQTRQILNMVCDVTGQAKFSQHLFSGSGAAVKLTTLQCAFGK